MSFLGSRKCHALFRLLQAWQKELDKADHAGTVLLDLSKGCDCLPHDLIIEDLRNMVFIAIF